MDIFIFIQMPKSPIVDMQRETACSAWECYPFRVTASCLSCIEGFIVDDFFFFIYLSYFYFLSIMEELCEDISINQVAFADGSML